MMFTHPPEGGSSLWKLFLVHRFGFEFHGVQDVLSMHPIVLLGENDSVARSVRSPTAGYPRDRQAHITFIQSFRHPVRLFSPAVRTLSIVPAFCSSLWVK
jgi:hypothetical protein